MSSVNDQERTVGSRFDVVIVGAGHNGLIASCYLAREGLRVGVFERRGVVGGGCSNVELFEGYTSSHCAATIWILQPRIIQELELERHGFAYYQQDPEPVNLYPGGLALACFADPERTKREIARLSPVDAARYDDFKDYWRRAGALFGHFFFEDPPSEREIAAHAAAVGETELYRSLRSDSIAEVCQRYFKDPRVQAAFVSVEDVGDPWTPGSAWAEAYVQAGAFVDSGNAVVKGGIGSLSEAIASAALEHGVEIHTETEVAQISLDEDDRAASVVLADGSSIDADVVVSNLDPKSTLRLLPAGGLPASYVDAVQRLKTEVGYLKFHAVVDELPDLSSYRSPSDESLAAGTIRIASSLGQFRDAYRAAMSGAIPEEPVIGRIVTPTVHDPTLTDRDGHIVAMWAMYAPITPREGNWDTIRDRTAERLIDHVTRYVPNFRSSLREWRLFTPQDLAQEMGFTDGSIRHIDMVPGQLMGDRYLAGYGYGTPIENVFLCGVGTHPGGEINGAPGHNAARSVLRSVAVR
jgi:phytoene dehydrogenase-like protein